MKNTQVDRYRKASKELLADSQSRRLDLLKNNRGHGFFIPNDEWIVVAPGGWVLQNPVGRTKYTSYAFSGCIPMMLHRADGQRVFLHQLESTTASDGYVRESPLENYFETARAQGAPKVVSAAVYGTNSSRGVPASINFLYQYFHLKDEQIQRNRMAVPVPVESTRLGISLTVYDAVLVGNALGFYNFSSESDGVHFELPAQEPLTTAKLLLHDWLFRPSVPEKCYYGKADLDIALRQ